MCKCRSRGSPIKFLSFRREQLFLAELVEHADVYEVSPYPVLETRHESK
jgi:hypothetical protein